jgi:hypothetical protein
MGEFPDEVSLTTWFPHWSVCLADGTQVEVPRAAGLYETGAEEQESEGLVSYLAEALLGDR